MALPIVQAPGGNLRPELAPEQGAGSSLCGDAGRVRGCVDPGDSGTHPSCTVSCLRGCS